MIDAGKYFRIVEFKSCFDDIELIHLNLSRKELIYQVYIPHYNYTVKKQKNGQTDFRSVVLPDHIESKEFVRNIGMILNEEQLIQLRNYCIVSDFEPYRNRTITSHDPGVIGSCDGGTTYFYGLSNSPYTEIELEMHYYHDEAHLWPCEKLEL
ncbi:MAG: hypothetical protein Q4B09_10245, partial [Lachnospiraceae bacterium]|nr:hypothetical protein [Lachnospiraceae bacterium]